jgi:hypothetical protein
MSEDNNNIKKIRERAEEAFSSPETSAYAKDALEAIRSNLIQAGNDVKRSALLLFLLIAVFELMTQSAIAEVSLGPFKLTNVALVQKLIPAGVGYYFHNLAYLATIRHKMDVVHMNIIRKVYKPIFESGLQYYITPHYGALTDDDKLARKNTKSAKILEILSYVTLVILFLGVISFEIYAFYRLFKMSGLQDILVWASLLTTLVFFIRGLIVVSAPTDE